MMTATAERFARFSGHSGCGRRLICIEGIAHIPIGTWLRLGRCLRGRMVPTVMDGFSEGRRCK